jgi:hypothetical protein
VEYSGVQMEYSEVLLKYKWTILHLYSAVLHSYSACTPLVLSWIQRSTSGVPVKYQWSTSGVQAEYRGVPESRLFPLDNSSLLKEKMTITKNCHLLDRVACSYLRSSRLKFPKICLMTIMVCSLFHRYKNSWSVSSVL